VFGLEPKLNLDLSALEHEFHRLSRKLHPDRFARAEENEKQWSLADTALLNDAYRTLRDPILRTEYLLKLQGAELSADSESRSEKDARVPADLLEEVFDLNMQLEEMRAMRKMGESDESLEKTLAEAKQQFSGMLSAVDDELREAWRAWDQGDAAAQLESQKRMVALLVRRRYLSNLVRDVTETLGA
ncbi:MAG: Fe-S protein assembly co-chaperone HscB, partial [Terracidiphilus sp.]